MSLLTQENIDKFSKKFNENNLNIITKNAISNNKLSEIVKDRDYLQKRNNVFSKYKEIDVKNTNQKIVDTANRDFRGIKSYLRNLDQFYKAPVETPTPSRTFRDNNSNIGLRPRGETRNRLKDLY